MHATPRPPSHPLLVHHILTDGFVGQVPHEQSTDGKVVTRRMRICSRDALPHGKDKLSRLHQALKKFAKQRAWHRALATLTDIAATGKNPSIIAYNMAINSCGKSEHWRQALALMAQMDRKHIEPDTIIHNSVISACEKQAQWQQALFVLVGMTRKHVQPDQISYSSAISACGNGEQWQHALSLFACMVSTGLEIDTIACNSIITACGKGGQWDKALHALSCMHRSVLDVGLVSYSATISACEVCERWEQALRLLAEFEATSLQGDATVYNSAMSACDKGGKWELTVGLLQQMRHKRLQPDAIALGLAILSCSTANKWEIALKIQDELVATSLNLDKHTYSLLLMEVEQMGLFERGMDLLQRFGGMNIDAHVVMKSLCAAIIVAGVYHLVSGYQDQATIRRVLQEAAHEGYWNTASQCMWRAFGGPGRFDVLCKPTSLLETPMPPRGQGCITWKKYEKELRLLQHVFDKAEPGDPESVCRAMIEFDDGERWSKLAGEEKMACFADALCKVAEDGNVLEIGTYCGYSAVRLATRVPKTRIVSLESDPTFVVISRNIIVISGLVGRIDVWTGHSKYLFPKLARKELSFRAVFMDRWGSQYYEELVLVESLGLLHPDGAVVVADAVLRYGASLFLWHVLHAPYRTEFIRVPEFGSSIDDSMSLSFFKKPFEGQPSPADAPLEFRRLHLESEAMRLKVIGADSDSAFLEEKNQFLDCMGQRMEGLLDRWDARLRRRRLEVQKHARASLPTAY